MPRMADPRSTPHLMPDIVLDDDVTVPAVPEPGVITHQPFDPSQTTHYQAKMRKAPVWFCSFLASNTREKRRFRDELLQMKGAWPLLMKQRNGGTWTEDDKERLKGMVQSASSVSPYLFIWAIPGSMVLLPFLAWYLDWQRKRRARRPAA